MKDLILIGTLLLASVCFANETKVVCHSPYNLTGYLLMRKQEGQSNLLKEVREVRVAQDGQVLDDGKALKFRTKGERRGNIALITLFIQGHSEGVEALDLKFQYPSLVPVKATERFGAAEYSRLYCDQDRR